MGKVKRARQKAHGAAVKVKQDKTVVNTDLVEVVEMDPQLVRTKYLHFNNLVKFGSFIPNVSLFVPNMKNSRVFFFYA